MGAVSTESRGAVACLTMSAPRRNALGTALIEELLEALLGAETSGARAVILRAEPGASVWSSGHDIAELPRDGDPLTWTNPVEALLRAVRQTPMPVIAAVEGTAWGAGCNLVLVCDLVVAAESAGLAITPVKLGVPYNTAGVAHFLAALPLNLAKEMFFTGEPVSAARLAEAGVVNRLEADESAMTAAAWELAETIADRAPLAVRAIKAEMTSLTDARALHSDEFERLTALRRATWRSADFAEGLAAFEERRPPRFEGR